jgi:hypothetical protein
MCLHGSGGLATAAPFSAPGDAFLGIATYRASSWGSNARSNRWAVPRSVRGRPCLPLKFQVIACVRGSDGR